MRMLTWVIKMYCAIAFYPVAKRKKSNYYWAIDWPEFFIDNLISVICSTNHQKLIGDQKKYGSNIYLVFPLFQWKIGWAAWNFSLSPQIKTLVFFLLNLYFINSWCSISLFFLLHVNWFEISSVCIYVSASLRECETVKMGRTSVWTWRIQAC